MMTKTITLSLLGPIQADANGRAIELKSSRAIALLVYLAMDRTYPHRREALMALLWPETLRESAQVSLRRALYLLRQALDDEQPAVSGSLVLSDKQTIQLHPDVVLELDVARFRRLLQKEGNVSRLAEAVALYRGDFLSDFYLPDSASFEEWAAAHRADLRRQALEAYDALVGHLMARGAYERAQPYAQQQLVLDPLHERGHRHLMEILARLGQRGQALAQYDTLRRLLQEELDIEPAPRTEALAAQIRQAAVGTAMQATNRIRGYELKEQLGAGAFGVVFRGVQPVVGREVAIKIIAPEHANRPDFIRRFEAEARIIARLEHPYIVPLYDYWREPDGAYLVMRYLRGGSLADRLQDGPFDLETAVRIVDQVTTAFAIAHRRGIVHRDIKPANILLDEEGNAYLSDFGIAKELQRDVRLTQEEMVIGSPAYLAPEQVTGAPVTPQSDIYSLGVVLYEMLTGRHPFADTPLTGMLLKHVQEPLPSTASHRPDLPLVVDTIIQQATAKTPAGRYPDARALARALQTAVYGTSITATRPVDGAALVNPYKGLRPFEEADADDFFGRTALVQKLLDRLGEDGDDGRFLAVVGPSGSGKSSVVQAGLLPALRRGALPDSDEWFVVNMTPGARPLDELEIGLLRVAAQQPAGLAEQLQRDAHGLVRAARLVLPHDGATLLLVIDQFEELFTAVADATLRDHFLDSLAAAVAAADSPLRLLITLRADFYDRPLLHADFGRLVRDRTAVVLPLTTAELTAAVVEPATRAGAALESGLVAAIVADVAEEAGALPMLQYALTELFARREGRQLTLAAYRDIGGVTGALARRADEVYAALDAAAQATARQLCLRLVTLGKGVEDTRRRVRRSELAALGTESQAAIGEVLDTMGQARLLIFDHDPETREPTVAVAHEALLREWGRLRAWLDESRDDVRLQRLLAGFATEWVAKERADGFLLQGSRLDQFVGWMDETTVALTVAERALLEASIQARQERRKAEAARRQRELATARQLATTEAARATEQAQAAANLRRRAVHLGAALVVALILAVAAGFFGRAARQEANTRATAQAQAQANLERATTGEAAAVANASAAATAEQVAIEERDRTDEQRALAVAAQATAEAEAVVRATAESRAVFEREAAETQADLARARELAAAALISVEEDPERSILLALRSLDLTYTPQAEDILRQALLASRVQLAISVSAKSIGDVIFSPDGALLASVEGGDTERVLYVRNAASGATLFTHPAGGNVCGTNCTRTASISPDGALLAMEGEDNAILVLDLPRSLADGTGQPLFQLIGHTDTVQRMNFSPDGTRLATSSYDNTVRLWDVPAGELLFSLEIPVWFGSAKPVFSPDGTLLAVNPTPLEAADRPQIFDAVTGQRLLDLPDSRGQVLFSADGERLLSINTQTIRVWDLGASLAADAAVELYNFSTEGRNANELTLSPDGSRLAVAFREGMAVVWRLGESSAEQEMVLSGHTAGLGSLAFSPDGTRLATAAADGIRIWDVSPAGPSEYLSVNAHAPGFTAGVNLLAVSPDGTRLATASFDGTAAIWDADTGELTGQLIGHEGLVIDVAYSPDGSRLVTAGGDQTARVWDAATTEEIAVLPASGDGVVGGTLSGVLSAVYSPDGRFIATAAADGTARVWDAATFELIQTVTVHPDGKGVTRVRFSPDSAYLAAATDESPGMVKVWDVNTGNFLLEVEIGPRTWGLSFSGDGERLAVSGEKGVLQIWDLSAGEPALTFAAPSLTYFSISLSPDGTQLASSGADGVARIWDVTSGELLRSFAGHTGFNSAITFSPDGSRLVTGGVDGIVQVFLLDVDELVAHARSRVTRTFTLTECQQFLHLAECPAEQ